MTTIHVFDNRHIKSQVQKIKQNDTIVLINSVSRKRWSSYFKYNNINEESLNINYIRQEEFFNMSDTKESKEYPFDVMLSYLPKSEGSKLI